MIAGGMRRIRATLSFLNAKMLLANPVLIGVNSVICELGYNFSRPSFAKEGGTEYLTGFSAVNVKPLSFCYI